MTNRNRRGIAGLILIFIIIIGDILTGVVSTHIPFKDQLFPLGVWNNMPSNSTLPFCFAANITDACELMSQTTLFPQVLNTSYRGVSAPPLGQGGLSASLQVGCIKPSNTIGALLQLQYANYSFTTLTNSSNFLSLGSPVFIDNRANFPCPGYLSPIDAGALPNVGNGQFMFRVVGLNGGGVGDSPRFNSISVNLALSVLQSFSYGFSLRGTAADTVRFFSTFKPNVATAINGYWIAFLAAGGGGNRTATATPFCTIAVGGTFCQATLTFSPSFSVTPQVYLTIITIPGSVTEPLADIPLLMAQTITA